MVNGGVIERDGPKARTVSHSLGRSHKPLFSWREGGNSRGNNEISNPRTDSLRSRLGFSSFYKLQCSCRDKSIPRAATACLSYENSQPQRQRRSKSDDSPPAPIHLPVLHPDRHVEEKEPRPIQHVEHERKREPTIRVVSGPIPHGNLCTPDEDSSSSL